MEELAYRAYNFMYRKYHKKPNYEVYQSRSDAESMYFFINGDLMGELEKSQNPIFIEDLIIKYFLIQFEHWTKYRPVHEMQLGWFLGKKAYERWTRYRLGYSMFYSFEFRRLLESWDTSIEEIKEYMSKEDGQPNIDFEGISNGLNMEYSNEITQVIDSKLYCKKCFDVLSVAGVDLGLYPSSIMNEALEWMKRLDNTSDILKSGIDHFLVDIIQEDFEESASKEIPKETRILMIEYIKFSDFESFIKESYDILAKDYIQNLSISEK